MPTVPDWGDGDGSICSMRLIPNGDNEAFLNILPFRGNLTASTESGWRIHIANNFSLSLNRFGGLIT